MYLHSFPRFWTWSIERFWFLFWMAWHWKPAIHVVDRQTEWQTIIGLLTSDYPTEWFSEKVPELNIWAMTHVQLPTEWLMDQPCAWSTLRERECRDWLTGMFFKSFPVQTCSSQKCWCKQRGRGHEPANVRQTFKHRFVPKLILIVSLPILIVHGRVNHRTRKDGLFLQLNYLRRQNKGRQKVFLLCPKERLKRMGGHGHPGPPPPVTPHPHPHPPIRSALMLSGSEALLRWLATGQAALPPCVPHCAVLVDNFGISMH